MHWRTAVKVTRTDGKVAVEFTPEELHIAHGALHQYGDHQLSQALKNDAEGMRIGFREQLTRARDLAVGMSERLDTECGRLGHGHQ